MKMPKYHNIKVKILGFVKRTYKNLISYKNLTLTKINILTLMIYDSLKDNILKNFVIGTMRLNQF